MFPNSTITTVRHRHRQRKAKLFLGIGCIVIFVAYASIISVLRNSWSSMSEYRQVSSTGIELLEYQQDEVAQLLGGPDNDIVTKNKKLHDIVAIERSLNKLLRRRRLMAYDEDTVETECKSNPVNTTEDDSVFPKDLFTPNQLKHGAIILHIIGLVYMFVALAIVCDEFFVPALDVITEWLDISDDVAGATFMAAGGSAPEFFTSVFGVFITQNNVGIGTIVGSAIFNILCVLAFCALFSKTVLHLTWWSLFRDVSFYVIGLFFLGVFFRDEIVEWHEALGMFSIYIVYAIFMKYNEGIEHFVKSWLPTKSKVFTVEEEQRRQSIHTLHGGTDDETTSHPDHRKSINLHAGAMFRQGLAHMALDDTSSLEVSSLPAASIDDLRRMHSHHGSTVNVKDGRTVLVGPPKLEKHYSFPAYVGSSGILNGKKKTAKVGTGVPVETNKQNGDSHPNFERSISTIFGNHDRTRVSQSPGLGALSEVSDHASPICAISSTASTHAVDDSCTSSPKGDVHMYPADNGNLQNTIINEEAEQPVDMSWPKTFKKQCIYLILLPIMWPLYMTLPDVKKENRRKFAAITFSCSVLWIAFYSYLMVWWANTIGITMGIPTEVMGLTILAAGTSIPDLITSVIVARKGLGDMAVSSSVGSNLFDICVGLPVPWLLYFGIQALFGADGVGVISVQSKGLICSVGLLFTMLVVLVLGIMAAGWRMNKLFGFVMLGAYACFCIVVVFLEVGMLTCPLRIVGGSC